jgi:2-polyprenyl-6-methoxyphenol hydroxylase-like FAD-dependent oxidoreductase
VLDAVLAGESLGDTAAYRFPAAVWRHYERLRRFPAGLLVIGDALCSLNPVYAQGMSVAAMEAAALRRCLEAGRNDLPRRFFRAAAGLVAVPWQMAAGADSPEASGNAARRLQATFMNRMFAAATRDRTVAAQLARVLVLLDPPASLMRPTMLWRVMTKGSLTTPDQPHRPNGTNPLPPTREGDTNVGLRP